MDLFHRFLEDWRLLHNRDRATSDALAKIRELQLGLEWDKGDFLLNRKIVNRAVEIDQRSPRHDPYDVPAGFSPKPRLTVSDFEGF